jgi:hypothetical protein
MRPTTDIAAAGTPSPCADRRGPLLGSAADRRRSLGGEVTEKRVRRHDEHRHGS